MKNTLMASVLLLVASAASAATVTTNGTAVVIDVPEGETYAYAQTLASPIATVTKTGAGTVTFSTAIAGFAGTFNINAGFVDFKVLNAYGKGPINVTSGAGMIVSHNSAGQQTVQVNGTVTIAGAGPDGKGALRYTGSAMGDMLFKKIELSADATWGGNRTGTKELDMQFHTLTWVGGNHMSLNCAWKNFGSYIHNGTADLCFQSATFDSTCTADKTITLANSTGYISFWNCGTKVPFKLVAEANSNVRVNSGSSTSANIWNGPVEVAAGKTLSLYANGAGKILSMNGKIAGAGSLTIGGAVMPKTKVQNLAGALTFTGNKNRHLTEATVKSGTLTLDGAGFFHTTNTEVTVGASNVTTSAKVVITNGSCWSAIQTNLLNLGTSIQFPAFYLGDTGTKPAIMEIDEGGSWTGKLYGVSSSANQKAAIYLKGGEFVQYSGPTADGYLAQLGYLYFGQTGGIFKMRAHTGLMRETGSACVYEMSGGRFEYIGKSGCQNFTLSRGNGHGEFYQTGGVFDSAAIGQPFRMGVQDYSATAGSGYAGGGISVCTLNGTNALTDCYMMDMGYRRTNAVSVLNLMQGTLRCCRIYRDREYDYVNCHAFVNFNGGTFKASDSHSNLFGTSDKNQCERVTVFEGGAVFDTAGKSVTVQRSPLRAPSGKGVLGIEIPANVTRTGYFGAPEVTITGDGMGATAHCCWDAATGTIGPVIVTSPGFDYTSATATIKSADRRSTINLTVTLGEPVGGGLVKKGAGTLTLSSTNTYAGVTRVEAGTLTLAVPQAIPVTNALQVAGGTVDLNGKTHVVGTLGGTGLVKNGTLTVTDALAFDAATAQDKTTNLVVTANVTVPSEVRITDVENLDPNKPTGVLCTFATPQTQTFSVNLPAPWRVFLADGGKSLRFVYQQATVLIFR